MVNYLILYINISIYYRINITSKIFQSMVTSLALSLAFQQKNGGRIIGEFKFHSTLQTNSDFFLQEQIFTI